MIRKYRNAKEKREAWLRSKKGVLLTLYRHQLTRSKRKGFPPPDYNHQYLYDRFLDDPTFCELYDAWVCGGFSRWDKPSIDRIDPTLPYTKSNIQMLSYRENARKADESERARTEVIMCDLDGTELRKFRSLTEAATFVGGNTANIGRCCKDMRYTAKGYRWKYGDVKKYSAIRNYVVTPNSEDPLVAKRRKVLRYWRDNPSLTATEVCRVFNIPNPRTLHQWRSRARKWREKRRQNPYV